MGDRIISIHQPNYFPWLGYFSKIARSDIFIVLDNVQFEKNGYINRVQINNKGTALWLTQPILNKGVLEKNISDIKFADNKWKSKHVKTLFHNYAKSRYFSQYRKFIEHLILDEEGNISKYNTYIIRELAQFFGLDVEIYVASDIMKDNFNDPTERLIYLVKKMRGNIYLSGKGGAKYQNEALFIKESICIRYSSYKPMPYMQISNGFIPGLSILDALFCIGKDEVRNMLKSNQ